MWKYDLKCHYCGSEYRYVKDKDLEDIELICFECNCGEEGEIAVPIRNPYLKEVK